MRTGCNTEQYREKFGALPTYTLLTAPVKPALQSGFVVAKGSKNFAARRRSQRGRRRARAQHASRYTRRAKTSQRCGALPRCEGRALQRARTAQARGKGRALQSAAGCAHWCELCRDTMVYTDVCAATRAAALDLSRYSGKAYGVKIVVCTDEHGVVANCPSSGQSLHARAFKQSNSVATKEQKKFAETMAAELNASDWTTFLHDNGATIARSPSNSTNKTQVFKALREHMVKHLASVASARGTDHES